MRTFLLLVVALAVGGGIGYLYGVSRSDGSHARAAAPRTGTSPATPERIRPHGDSDLARALRALPLPQVGLGSGRIAGTVRDEEGNGVASVTVRAVRVFDQPPRNDDGSPPATPDLEAAVGEFVHDFQRRAMTTVEAVTDSDGKYVLEGLAANAEYTLRAYLVEHEVRPAGSSPKYRFRPGETADWIARSVASLRVDVLLPDGRRPDSALIHCKRGNETSTRMWNQGRPEIRLVPGRYELSATAKDGPEEFKADAVGYEVSPGRNERTAVFRLRGSPGIRGEVRFKNGMKFRTARVYALRFAGDTPPSEEQLSKRGKETWVWFGEGGDKSYAFQDLPPGRYLVGVGARRGILFHTEVADVGNRMTTCDLEVTRIDPEDYVVLHVFGPNGEPVTDLDIDTSYETSTSSSSGGGTWARRDDGAYIVFHHGHDFEDGGTYKIEATSKEYGRKSVSYKRGETHELEIHFRAAAQMEVEVRGFADHPHATSFTFALIAKDDDSPVQSKAPDATGALTLGPLETGEYELVTYVSEEAHERIVAERQAVTLRPGTNRITVALPRLYPLTIMADAGTQLLLSRIDDAERGRMAKKCNDNGRAAFAALPAGRYQILSWGPGGGQMEVTLPGPALVTFKPGKLDALRVTVTDPAGTIAKAGFQDGDLVIALGGKEFENLSQLQMLMASAMGKKEVTFTVLRGGQQLELTVKIQDMMRGAQGGRLDPAKR